MFNLKSHKHIDDLELLRAELRIFDIGKSREGYDISIGDETVSLPSLDECKKALTQGCQELKQYLYETWEDLLKVSQQILDGNGQNSGPLDNLVFLRAVKKALQLSVLFTDLKPASELLRKLLDNDISTADDRLIRYFNEDYLQIQCLHRLIMTEIYREMLINRYMKLTKQAQISGPWANLDLPMKERIWEWDEGEEEYFGSRRRARREQVRYNPEDAASTGFYFVWQDLTRDPYKFEDMSRDSPYKSRRLLTIP